jgi:hypothetical protein
VRLHEQLVPDEAPAGECGVNPNAASAPTIANGTNPGITAQCEKSVVNGMNGTEFEMNAAIAILTSPE